MPKSERTASHRHQVSEAILTATARIIADEGLLSISMSRIACEAGISRATLYNYFSNVAEIVTAWHERDVGVHAKQLHQVSERPGTPGQRLRNVLTASAEITSQCDEGAVAVALHMRGPRGAHVKYAAHRLRDVFRPLVVAAQQVGELRDDISPDELTTFCLHALSGATQLSSRAAARRLANVTMDGMLRATCSVAGPAG